MAKKKSLFDKINLGLFLIIGFIMLIPIYKVLCDSLDMSTSYGMRLFPKNFSLGGYISVLRNPTLIRPFLVSVFTTLVGTGVALTITTIGAYVLIQYKMIGRSFLANMLVFTMVFKGGMIPTYLVINGLGMTNNLSSVILFPALNVFNLVLMRNFFENIPDSLLESATLDGCTPMQSFIKIVLPLSKAALASIGLLFAVTYWNDYTNYKLYITNSDWYNFQMKLRSIMMGSDLPGTISGVSENTVLNAAVIVAILPFMVIYPFLQKYFVKGMNLGAVKE